MLKAMRVCQFTGQYSENRRRRRISIREHVLYFFGLRMKLDKLTKSKCHH